MTVYILFWFVIAFIAMVMAGNRGRSPLAGCIAGLLFGVFAIIYYLVVGDSEQKRAERVAALIKSKKKK